MSRRSTVTDPGAVMSHALRLANRGYDRHMIAEALLKNDDDTLKLQRQVGAGSARRFAEVTAERAIERARSHPRDDWRSGVVIKIAEMREVADDRPWPGRTGPTDRRVLEGAFVTALLCRSTLFNCSIRTWASRVGLPSRTVGDAIRRLPNVELVKRGSRDHSAQYRLTAPMSRSRTVSLPREVPSVWVPDIPHAGFSDGYWLAHDAFRSSALGDAGWMLLRRLSPEIALRASEIAMVTGIERRRAYAVLGTLQRSGLATKVADGWLRPEDPDVPPLLDAVAIRSGTVGSLEADRRRFEADRRAYRDADVSVRVPDIVGETITAAGKLLNAGVRV